MIENYSIQKAIDFRKVQWNHTDELAFFAQFEDRFEPFPLKTNYFACGVVIRGNFTMEIDGQSTNLRKNEFLIVRPQQIIRMVDVAPRTSVSYVLFTKKMIESKLFDFSLSFLNPHFGSHVSLSGMAYQKIKTLFTKMFDVLIFLQDNRWEASAKNILHTLLSEIDLILESYKPKDLNKYNNRSKVLAEEFYRLVKQNFLQRRDLPFYADNLHISLIYLHKIVKQHFGTTPYSLIHSFLLKEAHYLLAYSDFNNNQIADKLSFSTAYTFSRYFKSKTQMSPSSYRKFALENG